MCRPSFIETQYNIMKVLMVCLGNICRSPLAEGLLRKKAEERGLDIEVDSAGFESCNQGMSPDFRTLENATENGLNISYIRSRLFRTEDFDRFDRIYVMDDGNYRSVRRFSRNGSDMDKVDYIMNAAYPGKNWFVDDPYYLSDSAFQRVYDQLDEACEAICNNYVKNGTL